MNTARSLRLRSLWGLIAIPLFFMMGCSQSRSLRQQSLHNMGPNWNLSVASLEGNVERVKALLAQGANVNNMEYGAVTPLHCAAMKGHKEVAAVLLAAGADVNRKSGKDRTPLWEAQFNGHNDVVELLREHGGTE